MFSRQKTLKTQKPIRIEDLNNNPITISEFEDIINWYDNNYLIVKKYLTEDYALDKRKPLKGKTIYDLPYIPTQNISTQEFYDYTMIAKKISKQIMKVINGINDVTILRYLGNDIVDIDKQIWQSCYDKIKNIYEKIFLKLLVYSIIRYRTKSICLKDTECFASPIKIGDVGLCTPNIEQLVNLIDIPEIYKNNIKTIYESFADYYALTISNTENNPDINEINMSMVYNKIFGLINFISEGYIATNFNIILIKKIEGKYIALYNRQSTSDKIEYQTYNNLKKKISNKSLSLSGTSYIDLSTGKNIIDELNTDDEKQEFINEFNKSKHIFKINCKKPIHINPDDPNSSLTPIIPIKDLHRLSSVTTGGFSKKYKHKKQTKITKHKNRKSKFKSKSKTKYSHSHSHFAIPHHTINHLPL